MCNKTTRPIVTFYETVVGIAGSDVFAVVNLSGRLDSRFFNHSSYACNKLAHFTTFENK